jgi:hypothetical protein
MEVTIDDEIILYEDARYPHITTLSTTHRIYLPGRDSEVRIATRYGLKVHGSNYSARKAFSPLQSRPHQPWGPPSLLYTENQVPFRGVMWSGCGINQKPHLVPRIGLRRAMPLLSFCACKAYLTRNLYLYTRMHLSTFLSLDTLHTVGRDRGSVPRKSKTNSPFRSLQTGETSRHHGITNRLSEDY